MEIRANSEYRSSLLVGFLGALSFYSDLITHDSTQSTNLLVLTPQLGKVARSLLPWRNELLKCHAPAYKLVSFIALTMSVFAVNADVVLEEIPSVYVQLF